MSKYLQHKQESPNQYENRALIKDDSSTMTDHSQSYEAKIAIFNQDQFIAQQQNSKKNE